MAEEVQLTPEQVAQYNQAAPVEVNPIRDFDATQLAELAVKDKEGFDLVGEFRRNQDLWADPAQVQKAADALDLVKQRGFELSDLPGPARIGKTVLESAKGFGKQLWNYGSAAVGMVQGALAEPFSSELATGFAEDVTRRLSSNIAGTEEAMAGLAQIPEKIVAKGVRAVSGPRTPEQKVADLWKDVGRAEVQQQRVTGAGPVTQAVTGGAAGELPAEEVSTLAAGDPFSFATFSKGFQLAGRAVPGVVRAAAAKTGEVAGDVTAATAGRTAQAGGNLVSLGNKAVASVAPAAGGVTGAVKGAALGGPLGVIPGIGVGAAGGRVIARAARKVSTAGAKVADIGKQVAGAKPVVSPLAQAGRDVLQAVPAAAGDVALGLGQDIGLSALTSETPAETESAIGLGTALGAAGAARRIAGRVISGQLIAPREYGVNTVTPSSGNFPTLDAIHSDSLSTATPGEQTRLNAIRLFAKGSAPGTDIFFAKDPQALTDALTQAGLSPDVAASAAKNEGFFTVSLPDRNGVRRPVIIARNVASAPHEAFHAIQDVLGEPANRQIDNIVRQEYADQWEQQGQRYASRLTDLAGRNWREAILDETGTGTAEAIEKLSNAISNEVAGQTGAEAPADFVRERVRAEWNQILADAQRRNPDATPQQVWRDILSPEEATQVADRYLARDLAAENFDAVFKNLGAALESNQPLVRRLAGVAAKLISVFGGEPLAGRRSEIGQVEPRLGVTEAVTRAAQATPTVETSPAVVTPKGESLPASPVVTTESQKAKQWVDNNPTGLSERDSAIRAMSDAIESGQGVTVLYWGAKGEPAGDIASIRPERRAQIESQRQVENADRQLVNKTFFPYRVDTTRSGPQFIGWSPDNFNANIGKLEAWVGQVNKARPRPKIKSPYEFDAATSKLTDAGRAALNADVQTFVANQKAGFTGSGKALVLPKDVKARGFTEPEKTGAAAIPLEQGKADLINYLFNAQIPETVSRVAPLHLAGQEISAATESGRLAKPVRKRGEYSPKKLAKAGITGPREVLEVNPFRQWVEQTSKESKVERPSLIEVSQRLNVPRIEGSAPAPGAAPFGGNILTLAAGFQPPAQMKRLIEMSQPEWKALTDTYKGKLGNNLTGWAWDVGASAKTVEDVLALRQAAQTLSAATKAAIQAGDFSKGMEFAGRGQAAREAFEAATGSNLEGTNAGSAVPGIRKFVDPDYQPPVPSIKQ